MGGYVSQQLGEMTLVDIPQAVQGSSLVLTNGQVLFPFADAPHITSEGVILHGRSAHQRALVYRVLSQSECTPGLRHAIPAGHARPLEPGGENPAFSFLQLQTLPALPLRSQPVPAVALADAAGSITTIARPAIRSQTLWEATYL